MNKMCKFKPLPNISDGECKHKKCLWSITLYLQVCEGLFIKYSPSGSEDIQHGDDPLLDPPMAPHAEQLQGWLHTNTNIVMVATLMILLLYTTMVECSPLSLLHNCYSVNGKSV